ncbi:MAG: MEKHLA domain-containing protein [Rhizobiales bacterium]|nr:MEKHLA domain-containing protein [Hyphomicrobiales bacterium]
MDLPSLTHEQLGRIACIGDSYQRLTGRPLVPSNGDPIEALWAASVAIVAHGTEPDPIFFFGNRTALALFEMDFETFTHLPSRFSAETMLQEERARILERVTRDGIIEDYAGVRISATGKRFRISKASVWTLSDGTGAPVGQAAAFAAWTNLAGG